MTELTVRYWGGAARAAGHSSEVITAATLRELRDQLARRPDLERICAVASFLVDGAQAGDAEPLPDSGVVDVLPPFAGGSAPFSSPVRPQTVDQR